MRESANVDLITELEEKNAKQRHFLLRSNTASIQFAKEAFQNDATSASQTLSVTMIALMHTFSEDIKLTD